MSDISFASATDLADRIQKRDISSVELLQHFLERVDRHNPDLNAIVVDMREAALEDAAAADRELAQGRSRGPLHGVPMTVKESYNVAGTPTTRGRLEWRTNIPDQDAVSIAKLRQAGAIIFGKTNVPLDLADFQSYNDVYGTTNNPYDLRRGPGGSSGGSAAALAAGLTGIETGSDIGGSIRNPAHYCGVFGHKPTHNLLDMRGHAPPGDIRADSDLSVIGPLARSAQDLETATRTMAGPDEIMARGYRLDLPQWRDRRLSDLRVGVWKNEVSAPVSQEVEARVEQVAQALRDEGAQVDDGTKPDFTSEHCYEVYRSLLHATMASRMNDADYESLKRHVDTLSPDDTSESAEVQRAQTSSFKAWRSANEKRHHLRWAWHEYFERYDIMLAPVTATAAFEHDHRPLWDRTTLVDNQPRPYFEQVFWSGLTGVAFLPSTVIPTGLNESGLPIGIQIVGAAYDDLITIGIASDLEHLGFAFTPPPAYV